MQERNEHLFTSKSQVDQLMEAENFKPDLLVLSIGSAHQTDKQQQCPSFCHEAASQGKNVAVINFDMNFKNSSERLCENSDPHLNVYYSTLAYKYYVNNFSGYSPKEFSDLVHNFLKTNPNAQVVLVYHMYTDMPKLYKQLVMSDDFLSLYKDRIFFIGSYYQGCSGFVYNQEYIAKHEIYARTAYQKRLLKQEQENSPAYQNYNPDEKFKKLERSFSSAWDSLQQYEGQKKEGCIGKTVKKNYGIDAYQEIAPKTDATIGYRFISLEYLSLNTVLQSAFNLDFLAKQRALEVDAFMLNKNNTSAEENTELNQTENTLPTLTESEEQKAAVAKQLIVDLEDFVNKDDVSETVKRLLSELMVFIHAIQDCDSKQTIIQFTHDFLIKNSCDASKFVGHVTTYFFKAKKEGKSEPTLDASKTTSIVWNLGIEIDENRRIIALNKNESNITTPKPNASEQKHPSISIEQTIPEGVNGSKSTELDTLNQEKAPSQVFKPDTCSHEKTLDELILTMVRVSHAKSDLKQQKIAYLKFLEQELNSGNYDKNKIATYLLNHPTHLLKQERSIFAFSTRYSNETASILSALDMLGHKQISESYMSPSF